MAITVYAFERGGLRETGIAAASQLVPAAIIAPLAAYLGDRFRRDLVLAGGFAVVAVACCGVALAITAGVPSPLVYAVAAMVTSGCTIARPAVSALLPTVTDTPDTLTAATVGIDLIVNLGIFAGPAMAGLLLGVGDSELVFWFGAVACAAAAATVLSIRFEPARVRPTGRSDGPLLSELRAGFEVGRRDPAARSMLLMATVGFFVSGALDVFFVSIAFDLVGGGESLSGFLGAANGLGGLVGVALSIALVGGARIRPAISFGALVGGVPILLIVATPNKAVALGALAVSGVGLGALHVASRTFLQRTTPDDVLVRVFGVMESSSQLALAAGALCAGVVSAELGTRPSLALLAVVLPVATLLAWATLSRADKTIPLPNPNHLALLRSDPMFAPLSPPALEQLALNARSVMARAGDVIIRKGDEGDRFYMVVHGQVQVHRGADSVASLGDGGSFGEIALLRAVPRTADVTATTDTEMIAIGRSVFLEAVTGHPRVHDAVEQMVTERINGR